MNVELIERLRKHYADYPSAADPISWSDLECAAGVLRGWGELRVVSVSGLERQLGISKLDGVAMFFLKYPGNMSSVGISCMFNLAPLEKQKAFLDHMFQTLLDGKMELPKGLLV